MLKTITRTLLALTAVAVLTACPDTRSHTTGVYMLLDTSGTYTQELDKARNIINYLLAELDPGDALAVARIDSGSFSEKDIIAKVKFDSRPSMANEQKRAFREKIDAFIKNVEPAPYTDISGGLLQAVEFLDEAGTGNKRVLVFSDLKEDLPEGHVRDFTLQLDGYNVVALNVTKLRSDVVDPREYLDRVESWRKRIEAGGGEWRVINDLDNPEKLLIGEE